MYLEGEQAYLGDLLTMVIDHLLTGMILQVATCTWRQHPFLLGGSLARITMPGVQEAGL